MRTIDGPSPIVDQARHNILEWFTGKAQVDAANALDMLADSEAAEEWTPGASRRVEAALSKSNVARKLYSRWKIQLDAIGDHQTPREERGWEVAFLLQFSQWQRGQHINFDAVKKGARSQEVADVVEAARTFMNDFAPLVDLISILDATKPKPVITSVGASPTITRLLKSLGLLLNIETIRMPPIEWVTVEKVDKDGRKYLAKVGHIQWPRWTLHNTSPYAGTDRHEQCQACGHAIKNPYNWVPLLLDDENKIPHSLWVGKDCAETLFGVRVKGDLDLAE